MQMMKFNKIALICALSLVACTPVRQVKYKQSLDSPQDASSAPIKFTKLRTQLPVGSEIGQYRESCFLSSQIVGRDFLRRKINQQDIDDIFAETLETQGYDIVSRLSADFAEEYEADLLRSEYQVSAKIIDAQFDACDSKGLNLMNAVSLGLGGAHGKLYLKIKWAVMDNLRRKIIYKTTTEGYVKRNVPNIEGWELMMNEAFGMAAHNLGSDPNFHDVMFFGAPPPQDWKKPNKEKPRPRLYDPHEDVVIDNLTLSNAALLKHIEKTGEIAVLVQAGASHGSGFFITKQGHILTNAHVIGNADRVRIVMAGRKEKLIAEVLRRNPKRDVALLKLEEIPEDLNIATAPIKIQWPQVSEEIYALGAPKFARLQDTLSKGIVSAHRKNFGLYGAKLDFIQGDVSVHGGNSGGALLDANGNVVGIVVSGFSFDAQKTNAALNLFIPIEDALERLHITLKAGWNDYE